MSKAISLALPCWAPPAFPDGGRLLLSAQQVTANYEQQVREESQYKEEQSRQVGWRYRVACCQSLHISLFFDGTGNNEKNDTDIARPPHPSNIARLYHATYLDAEAQGYYRYYIPGVGTPFPKINEFDYSMSGLAFASGGEDRINWGLLRVADALMHAVTKGQQRLEDEVARGLVADMRSRWPMSGIANRQTAINTLLRPLQDKVRYVRPRLLAVKLFVYGFSRGAAEARTFVSWLSELFSVTDSGATDCALLGLPVSVEFLGLLDTVPSVGIAHIAPGASGHMAWADGTQQLPATARFPGLIKHCCHFVAAHEQRLSFPLDSVRRPEGHYPDAVQEVVYPGMHSDVGGGYPPGEQGKSCASVGELQSQIVLHDLYLAAFDAGAPLAVIPDAITPLIKSIQPSREMDEKAVLEFDINDQLIKRFNQWRKTLFSAANEPDDPPASARSGYHPHRLPTSLEHALIDQMAWMTAWRIGRYAYHSLLAQPFYRRAPQLIAAEEAKRRADYDDSVRQHQQALNSADHKLPNWQDSIGQGPADYDPLNAQYQLREAAREFQHDYHHWFRDVNGSPAERTLQIVLDVIPTYPVYLLNGDDERAEYEQMKESGISLYGQLFTDRLGSGTRKAGMAALLAFYDDQLHDSRAWFMQSTLGGREPWGGYFRYRMIYCGHKANKQPQLISVQGKVAGAAPTSNRVDYIVEYQEQQGHIREVHKVRDLASGEVQTLSAQQMLAADPSPGLISARQRSQIIAREQQATAQASIARLEQAGAKIV